MMLFMLQEGSINLAQVAFSVLSMAAIVALTVAILAARQRAGKDEAGLLIWPLVLAPFINGVIIIIAALMFPGDGEGRFASFAKMLTNEPPGLALIAIVGWLFAARYAAREGSWQFFLPTAALILVVQLQSIAAAILNVPPFMAGASVVIVAAVLWIVLGQIRAPTLPD